MAIKGIVCIGANGVMGNKGSMPWGDKPLDGLHFQNLTKGQVVLMGRKTFWSMMGEPLPNRVNIVLSKTFDVSHDPFQPVSLYTAHYWVEVLRIHARYHKDKDLWVIGGATVFEQFLPFIEELYVTTVGSEFEGDTYLPNIHERYRWFSHLIDAEEVMVPTLPPLSAYDPNKLTTTDPNERIQINRYHLTYRRFTKELEPHVTEFLKAMYGEDTPREKREP